MSGQQADGRGSPGSPGRYGTTLHSSRPSWGSDSAGSDWAGSDWAGSDGAGQGERRDAPAGFGRPEHGGGSYRESSYREGLSERAGTSGRPAEVERSGYWDRAEPSRRPDASRRTEGPRRTEVPAPRDGDTGPSRAPGLPAEHHPLRRGEISHLARDSRVPVWRRRLIIAVAVGVLFTVFTDWRIGLTLAVVAAIADAFISSRSTAASTSRGLVSGAQRRTKRELDKLERSGYRSLHIREIPGSDEVIDHLLVGPNGVYAIDSEQWDKRLPVRTRNGRKLYHGPYSQKDRLEHAHWEAAQASELIGNALGEHITVRPAMAVYGPSIPWGFATIRDVDVFSGDKLRKYLRRHRAGRDERLGPAEVERIYTAADKVLPAHR